MKPHLLEVLRCPACRGRLELRPDLVEGEDVVRGELACGACATPYPISQGVPQFSNPRHLHRPSQAGFSYQWRQRQDGAAESSGIIYGYRVERLIRRAGEQWLDEALAPGRATSPWILDAGCGSAEKSAELARRYPDSHVIALDQSTVLPATAARNRTSARLTSSRKQRCPEHRT